ncbi:MAG: hypothetical protein ACREXS_20835 [Gammaproteobacteria bacterium]
MILQFLTDAQRSASWAAPLGRMDGGRSRRPTGVSFNSVPMARREQSKSTVTRLANVLNFFHLPFTGA